MPITSTPVVADNSSFGGPNATQAANANTALGITPTNTSAPIDASTLGSSPTPFNLPPPPADNTPSNTNTLSSIPSIASIVGQESQETPAQLQDDADNAKLTDLEGQDAQKTVATTTAESNAGLPALNAQLTDLNSQITALKNQASAIPIQDQTDATGRGITTGGLASVDSANLRNNTVKALGLSSLASALQGNIATAQSQADAAVKAQFDPIEANISYLQDAIANNKDQMTEEEKAQSDTVQAELADRTTQIAQQKQDMSTAQAWAAAAMKNNPGDPAAQQAAQQVLGLDFTQPGALQQALALVGQYQSDPVATAQAVANLQSTRADVAYKTAQTNALLNPSLGDGGTLAQSNLKTTSDGTQYIDGSSLTGANEQAAQKAAAAAGIPYISAADSAVLDNISATQNNLASIENYFNTRTFGTDPVQEAEEADDFDEWRNAMITGIKALGGAGGGGTKGAALVQQLMDSLPSPVDPNAVANKKIATLNTLLTTAQQSILGTPPTASAPTGTTMMTGPQGTFNVPNAQVATFKANGYK